MRIGCYPHFTRRWDNLRVTATKRYSILTLHEAIIELEHISIVVFIISYHWAYLNNIVYGAMSKKRPLWFFFATVKLFMLFGYFWSLCSPTGDTPPFRSPKALVEICSLANTISTRVVSFTRSFSPDGVECGFKVNEALVDWYFSFCCLFNTLPDRKHHICGTTGIAESYCSSARCWSSVLNWVEYHSQNWQQEDSSVVDRIISTHQQGLFAGYHLCSLLLSAVDPFPPQNSSPF